MSKDAARALFLSAAFMVLAGGTSPAATTDTPVTVAQASPAPAATATPNPLTFGGYVRSYYFTRQNATGYLKTNSQFNQASWNTGASLHAAYTFGGNWSVGGTYLYADPFNGCGDPASHVNPASPCYKSRKFTSPAGGTNPDDTLPGYRLNTLYEAYVQYKDANLYAKIGNQVINTPWANASDSRIKPVAFQGGDLSYKFNDNWTGEVMYMDRWEDRVQSAFLNSNILTQNGSYPDAGGIGNTGIPKGGVVTTNGFGYGRLGYTAKNVTANVHYYAFQNVANALWADAKLGFGGSIKPFIALQGGTESNTGSAIAGKIDSQVFGVQGGITPWKNVEFTVSYNYIPEKSATVTLPAGAACGSNDTISGTLQYFLPGGGTPNCHTNTDGTTTVYYGGWASPYTDSYATDPLFTTSISQGMADRRSPGNGVKVAGTFYTDNKQVRLIAGHAWYAYGNGVAGVAPTQETDIDGTYFFSKVGKGPYHGFSLRHRYAERTQGFATVFGALPVFKYNRTQLEYDF